MFYPGGCNDRLLSDTKTKLTSSEGDLSGDTVTIDGSNAWFT